MSTQPPDSQEPRAGQVLDGRYRIIQKIAEGAMGEVYLAERLKLRRRVAIKFLRESFASDERLRARFEREARAMSRLDHPNCVSVIDFGVDGGPYIVMEKVTGTDLQDLLEHGRVAPERAVDIARQMLAGLAHAHGQGIIHRDIKPGNVMLSDATGSGDYARLLDFGLAKLHEPSGRDVSTASLIVGTPSYMSPEQSLGDKLDDRTDIYSTAVVLYELLTGAKPFTADDTYETLRRHREDDPPPMSEVAPDAILPDGLEEVVRKALAKDPDDRYQTAIEMADALEEIMSDHRARVPAAVSGAADRTAAVRPRRGSASTLAFLLLIGGVAAGGWYLASRLDRDEPSAARSADAGTTAVGAPTLEMPPVAVTSTADAAAADAAPPDASTDAGRDAGADASPDDLALDDAGVDDTDDVGGPDEASDEPAAPPEPEPAPLPLTLDAAKQLIADGKREQAISHLRKLKRKNPKSAHIPYLLGNLYFEKGWWVAGIEAYDACLRNNRRYRVNPTLIRNTIRSLASNKSSTRRKAYALILDRIGSAAVPRLRKAAKKDRNPRIRSRAKWVLKKMGRR